jgi:hypothetical protein
MGKAGGIKMGWDSRPKHYGEKVDVAKEVTERYTWVEKGYEVLKVVRGSRMHGETPYYVAVKAEGEVYAGICLTKVTKSDVWMKSMDETCGPYFADAKAAAILPFLTKAKNEFAQEWREKVKEAKATA